MMHVAEGFAVGMFFGVALMVICIQFWRKP
jgi:hypothetical protein